MPADRRAGAVLVQEGHRERFGIHFGPLSKPGSNRPQELRKGTHWAPAVGQTEGRHPPPRNNAAHLEVRKHDTADRIEELLFLTRGHEVLAILEARWHIGREESGRLRHESSVAWRPR